MMYTDHCTLTGEKCGCAFQSSSRHSSAAPYAFPLLANRQESNRLSLRWRSDLFKMELGRMRPVVCNSALRPQTLGKCRGNAGKDSRTQRIFPAAWASGHSTVYFLKTLIALIGVAQSVQWPGYGLGSQGFESRKGQKISFSKTSWPALGPTWPLIQWLPGFITAVKWPGCEMNHSPPSSAEDKNERNYTSTPPICLHGLKREQLHLIYVRGMYEYRE
jgi:hypothetical protein